MGQDVNSANLQEGNGGTNTEAFKRTESAWLKDREVLETCIEEERPDCITRCPFRLDIREILGKVQKGQLEAAFRRYSNTVAFPSLVSRYCDAPCREHCVMAKRGGAIDLPRIERALIRASANLKPNRYNLPKKAARIAVIGAGLSGLGCALRLLNRKYEVTVFEALEKRGGSLLRTGDPEFIEEEINRQFQFEHCDWQLGTRITDVEALIDAGYRAVYIATGKDGDRFSLVPPDASGLGASEREGVFYGGSLTGSTVMEALAEGLSAAGLIEGYLKTGIMRGPEPVKSSRIVLAERFLKEKPRVLPEAPDGEYTKEEAVKEAGRCALCRCDACMRGCALMEYHRKIPKRISAEVYVSVRPGTLDGNGTVATRLIGSCNHCGFCTDACPSGIDIDGFLLKSHSLMRAKGTMPWAWHEYWLRDMDFAGGEASFVSVDRQEGNPYLFFPGCQIGGSDPRYVTETYRLLREQEADTGLLLSCCGAPAVWGSDREAHEKALSRIRDTWEKAKKPIFLLACPSCLKMFETYLPEIRTQSVYEFLAERGVKPERKGEGSIYRVFDPCSSRGRETLQKSVRELAASGGYELDESGEEAVCCSYGGQIDIANPRYADWLAEKRAFASDLPYLTYCVNCRDSFAAKKKDAVHILDLILNLNRGDRPVPGPNDRHLARRALKRYYERAESESLSAILQEEAAMAENERFYAPDPELRKKLDLEHLIWEDIRKIVLSLDETGDLILDEENDCLTGHRMLGNMTCWVSYRAEDGRYRVLNAYAHRMKLEEA